MEDKNGGTKKIGRPKGVFQNSRMAILEGALKVFAEQGFSGASISKIAKETTIAQSLIYHYFSSKLDLWQAVKDDLVVRYNPGYMNLDENMSVDILIYTYVNSRFHFYLQHPEILRMILWQCLEDDSGELSHPKIISETSLLGILRKKQRINEINADINLEYFFLMISEASTAPLLFPIHKMNFMNNVGESEKYVRFVSGKMIEMLKI